MNLSKLWEIVEDTRAWCGAVHRVAKSQTQLSNWTTIFSISVVVLCLSTLGFIESLYDPYFESFIRWSEVKWSRSVVSNSLRPVDCSPPSFSVHGILQARILEWVAISFSRGSSRPRDRTQVPHITGRRFNLCTTREALYQVDCLFPFHLGLFLRFCLVLPIGQYSSVFSFYLNVCLLLWFR